MSEAKWQDNTQWPPEQGKECRGAALGKEVPWIQLHMAQTGRLKIAKSSIQRFKDKVRDIVVGNASRKLDAAIAELNPVLRGWTFYFRLTETKRVLEDLDSWMRRKLRCLLWRQWKHPATRNMRLQARGLDGTRAWKSASNGRGPWWNAGASHINAAYPKRVFDLMGLVSVLDAQRRFQHGQ